MKKQLKYKFLHLKENKIVSDRNNFEWEINKLYTHKGEVSACNSGFHCSLTPLDALSFVKGQILAVVETSGKSDIQNDKEAWEKMKIVTAYKWDKIASVKLAVFAAEQVIEIYEKQYPNDDRPRKAIEAAKNYLANPDAAAHAADAAAHAADAAADAADAAYAAAYAAAHAADAAAYAAARAARAAAHAADAAAYAAYAAAYAAYAAAYAAADAAAHAAYAVQKVNEYIINEIIPTLEIYEGK